MATDSGAASSLDMVAAPDQEIVWKRFTPADVDSNKCLARIWNGGDGGQCQRNRHEQSDFCKVHGKDDNGPAHGRVDGPIPEQKLQEFLKAANGTKEPRPAVTPSPKKRKVEPSGDMPSSVKEDVAVPDLPQVKRLAGGAYGIFLAERRPEFTEQCAGQPVTAAVKLASKTWKELDEDQKKPYQEKYAIAKAKYEEDRAAFLAAGGIPKKRKSIHRKSQERMAEDMAPDVDEDPAVPNLPQIKKPAGGAYGIFLTERRREFTELCASTGRPVSAVAKLAHRTWKELDEVQKKPYEEKYAIAKAKYKEDLKKRKSSFRKIQKRRAEDMAPDVDEDPAVPNLPQVKKPAGGAYGIFLTERRREFTEQCAGQPATAVAKLASRTWKELDEDQRKPYEEKYKAAKAKYDVDKAAFLAAGGKQKRKTAGGEQKRHLLRKRKRAW